MLLQIIENVIILKTCSKKYMFVSLYCNNFKIIFALQRKVIVFYIQVTMIEVLGFDWPIEVIFIVCI